jgi:hypothetical protein
MSVMWQLYPSWLAELDKTSHEVILPLDAAHAATERGPAPPLARCSVKPSPSARQQRPP